MPDRAMDCPLNKGYVNWIECDTDCVSNTGVLMAESTIKLRPEIYL